MRRFCAGCFISGRHILTSTGYVYIIKKSTANESQFFGVTAVVGEIQHKIKHTVYHNNYNPRFEDSCRCYDIIIVFVCLLVIFY